MTLAKTVYLGEYPSIEAVWTQYPAGGIEGEYVLVGGVEYGWNKWDRIWAVIDETQGGTSGGTGTGTGSGTGTDNGGSGGGTTGGDDKEECCGCHPVVNVYNNGGCCGGSNLIELAVQTGKNTAEIERLREDVSKCTGEDEGCCSCHPVRLHFNQEDFCTIEMTEAEAIEAGLIKESQSEGEGGMEVSEDMEMIDSGDGVVMVCTTFSAPDGSVENKLIGVYGNGMLAEEASNNNGGNTTQNDSPINLLG